MHGDKTMDKIIVSVKLIPLSAKTAVHRVHVLAEDVQRLVIDEFKEARYLLLAIDESTENADISQMFRRNYFKILDCHLKKSTWLSQMVLLT